MSGEIDSKGSDSEEFDAVLRAVAAAPPVALPKTPVALTAGTVIDDTFRIESELGKGAMGVVYLATDLALDRRVALKLHTSTSDDPRASRMWREARAMARLAHPNVATVHEVGVYADRVYIAMELVDGGTVRQWLEAPRTWRDIVGVFVQAARGLAAAHHVGLVHRDFKPSNVLVGLDGRVRVADFGLARAATDGEDLSGASWSAPSGRSPSVDERVTASGTAVGTPAYMAPEQLSGGRPDPRSDQYAFSVSLYEALYGVWPAVGESAEGISIVDGVLARRPSAPGKIPPWLRAIVMRGLETNPDDRFPDMDAVAIALESDPTRRRRVMLGSAVVVLAGLGLWGGVELQQHRGRSRCRAEAAAIELTWTDESQARLRDALVATGVPFAENSFERMVPFVERHIAAWSEQYAGSCIAAEVDGTRDPLLWAASRQCLDSRRSELESLLEALADQPDATSVQDAVTAVAGVGRLERCSDDAWLERHPPDEHAAAAEQRVKLRRAVALRLAGHYDRAFELARELLAVVDEGDLDLHAEAAILAGELAHDVGQTDEASTLLAKGFETAMAAGDDDRALEAATELVYTIGSGEVRHEEALWWAQVARGLLRRVGGEDAWVGAALHNNVGMVYGSQGLPERALAEHERALEIRVARLGPVHPDVAYSHNNLGTVYLSLHQYDDAERELDKAASILIEVMGSDHPQVAIAHNNLGNLYTKQQRYADAERAHGRALAAFETGLGEDHPQTAISHTNLGKAYAEQGRHEEAERELQRAIAIRTQAFGSDHPSLGVSHNHLGNVYLAQQRNADAEQQHARALAIARSTLGPEHPRTAASHNALGRVYRALGRLADAEREYKQALWIFERVRGPEDPQTAKVRANLAALRRELGRQAP